MKIQMCEADVIIFGGGIAGLWILNRLYSEGYNCVLIEKNELGCSQTLASQGMIHGGQKYILPGKKSGLSKKVAELISGMPQIWHSCIEGKGEIDLSGVKVLTESQYMWSPRKTGANIAAFIASKNLNTKVKAITDQDKWPEIFRKNRQAVGKLYRMDEAVIDMKSLISVLGNSFSGAIYQADIKNIFFESGQIKYVTLYDVRHTIKLKASYYIFATGINNENIIKSLGITGKKTQRRPLKQVMIRDLPYKLYAHCIGLSPKPQITITAHPQGNGKYIWYCGGLVAEKGKDMTDEKTIDFTYNKLKRLFPNIDWSTFKWSTFYIDRAEPYIKGKSLPGSPEILTFGNTAITWPIKMTLAPALANKVLEWVNDHKIIRVKKEKLPFSKTKIGYFPWETVNHWKKIKQ